MEIKVGAYDIRGHIAERFGYVNRAPPDAWLDAFVARILRSPSRNRDQQLVNVASLPTDAELQASWDALITSVRRPAA